MTPLPSVVQFDISSLQGQFQACTDEDSLRQAVVNAPFGYEVQAASIFLGIIVLLLVDPQAGTINRVALTNNEHAERAKRRSAKKFEAIKIPLGHAENIIAKAIATNEPQSTVEWRYLFVPELSPEQASFNQADAGIGFSAVYPLQIPDGGALIFSYYQTPDNIGDAQRKFMSEYAAIVSSALAGK